jgi:hypothetical protein
MIARRPGDLFVMSRRQSRSNITRQPRSKAVPREERLKAAPPAPASPPETTRSPARFWAVGFLAVVLPLVLLAVVAWVLFQGRAEQKAEQAAQRASWGLDAAPPGELTADEMLCDRFARLHNAGDPAAASLLGRVPVVPDGPLSSEEVNRWQADWFLREPVEILRVGPERRSQGKPAGLTGRFVFVTKGNVAAPTLQERTPSGVERSQRTMSNPDLMVEVRDGKVYGVRAELHAGP